MNYENLISPCGPLYPFSSSLLKHSNMCYNNNILL